MESLVAELGVRGAVDSAIVGEIQRLAGNVAAQMERHRRRETDVAALVDAAREFASLTDIDALLKLITRRARLLLGVDMSYISFPDESADDGGVYIRTADGHTSVLSVGLRLPGTAGLGNKVVISSAPFWTADYLQDQRIQHSKAIDDVVAAEGLHAIMAVPLSYGTKPFGALYVGSRATRRFSVDEVSLMSSLGDLAGVAIERAVLQEHTDEVIADLRHRHARTESTAASLVGSGAAASRVMELAAGGSDLAEMVSEIHRHLGGAVELCSADGDVLVGIGDMRLGDHEARTACIVAVQAAREPASLPGGLWAMPLRSGGHYFGALLARPGQEIDDAARTLMQVGAHAVTLCLRLDRSSADDGGQSRDELLDDLLAEPQRPPQQLVKRALRLGVDLDRPHVVVVVRPKGDSLGRIDVWSSSFSHRSVGLKTLHRGYVVLLLPGDDSEKLVRAAFDSATASLGEELTASSSAPITGPESVVSGFQEAVRCMEAMGALGLGASASSARELGFIGILLSDHHNVDGFVQVTIGPILDYDELRSTELTRTIEAYFEEGGSPTYAARKLHVHANTVARRLERITGLLGPDWQQPSRALEVQLALKLHRVRNVIVGPAADGPPDGQLA